MNLTNEQIAMLSALDRDMDSGAHPYVRDEHGQRWAFSGDVLQDCGCVSGQTASHAVITALMQANIARIESTILINKMAPNA